MRSSIFFLSPFNAGVLGVPRLGGVLNSIRGASFSPAWRVSWMSGPLIILTGNGSFSLYGLLIVFNLIKLACIHAEKGSDGYVCPYVIRG